MTNKNVVNNSVISLQEGNIHIGDKVFSLERFGSYSSLVEDLENTKIKYNEFSKKYREKNQLLELESDNLHLRELTNFLGNESLILENSILDIKNRLTDYTNNLLDAITLCLSYNNTSININEIEELLHSGDINAINSKLNVASMIKRRNLFKIANKSINSELFLISKELLLKAKTVQLDTNNLNRKQEAHEAFTESINTFQCYENLSEFARFLDGLFPDEAKKTYRDLIKTYGNTLSLFEQANLTASLSHNELVDRDLQASHSSNLRLLFIYDQIKADNKGIIINFDLLEKRA